ncbi:MAG: NAD(P)-dependent oxidoreductase [Solirubrobacterales bacterium]|nr:NAD(P)-dependent oxidoreductase [Solirubrobacterales bacterium]
MNVSLLGLGHMGAAIADRLLEAGHHLAVWNRTPAKCDPYAERGADRLKSPVDAWAHGDLAITLLADTAAVDAVFTGADGLLSGGAAGCTAVEMSTISVSGSVRLAEQAAAAGVAYLRAPVTGSPAVVAAGNLGIIISGPRGAYDNVEPLLRDIGPNHFHVGDGDEARVVKLGLNLMLGGTAQLMSEALVLSEAHGIDRASMLEVMAGSVMGSPFVKYKAQALIDDDYRSTFTTRLLYKDLGLALESGNAAGVPLPATALVQQLAQATISSGMGELDLMALLPWLRRESGLDGASRAAGS